MTLGNSPYLLDSNVPLRIDVWRNRRPWELVRTLLRGALLLTGLLPTE